MYHHRIPIWVKRAADARALGASIGAAAEVAGKKPHQLRFWIDRNESKWHRLLRKVRQETRDSACDEAVSRLRKQLRQDESKTIISAAGLIARNCKLKKIVPQRTTPADVNPFAECFNSDPNGAPSHAELHLRACEEEERIQAELAARAGRGPNPSSS